MGIAAIGRSLDDGVQMVRRPLSRMGAASGGSGGIISRMMQSVRRVTSGIRGSLRGLPGRIMALPRAIGGLVPGITAGGMLAPIVGLAVLLFLYRVLT